MDLETQDNAPSLHCALNAHVRQTLSENGVITKISGPSGTNV